MDIKGRYIITSKDGSKITNTKEIISNLDFGEVEPKDKGVMKVMYDTYASWMSKEEREIVYDFFYYSDQKKLIKKYEEKTGGCGINMNTATYTLENKSFNNNELILEFEIEGGWVAVEYLFAFTEMYPNLIISYEDIEVPYSFTYIDNNTYECKGFGRFSPTYEYEPVEHIYRDLTRVPISLKKKGINTI